MSPLSVSDLSVHTLRTIYDLYRLLISSVIYCHGPIVSIVPSIMSELLTISSALHLSSPLWVSILVKMQRWTRWLGWHRDSRLGSRIILIYHSAHYYLPHLPLLDHLTPSSW